MLHQESLGGNAKTSLVIAVANALQHVDETLQSLQFGSRAMRVHTQASPTTKPLAGTIWGIHMWAFAFVSGSCLLLCAV